MNDVRSEHDDRSQSDSVNRDYSAVANEEREFVAAAKKGDSAAFGFLCKQYASMVFHIARRILPTKEDAEDAVQESFQLAFIHLGDFKGDSRFSTWLTRIVTNAALMQLRKASVHRKWLLDESYGPQSHSLRLDVADQTLNPEWLYAQKERHWMLRNALSELTSKTRMAIELRELNERSTLEAARMMGVSVSALKGRVFHGRKKLRRLLSGMKSRSIHGNQPLRFTPKLNGSLRSQVPGTAGD